VRNYSYIGSPDFLPKGEFPPRHALEVGTLAKWLQEHRYETDLEECVAATWVVDLQGVFWFADRATEHVACARLGKVLSAGEVFFQATKNGPRIERITNQSTGFCPESSSWLAVFRALEGKGVEFPDGFEPAFEFRRCRSCCNLALVKDEDYTCVACGNELPEQWNLDE
jgi:hypothetical protein